MILDGEGGKEVQTKTKKERMKVKLLQFHENHRPAYYGTWQKTSSDVKARRPLGKDTVSSSAENTVVQALFSDASIICFYLPVLV